MEAAFERSLAFQVEDVGIHLLRLKRPLEKATPHAAFGEPARRDGSQRRQSERDARVAFFSKPVRREFRQADFRMWGSAGELPLEGCGVARHNATFEDGVKIQKRDGSPVGAEDYKASHLR